MVQVGLAYGAQAAIQSAHNMGYHVSQEYLAKLSNLPSEMYPQGSVDESSQANVSGGIAQMQNITMPLYTFEKFNVPMDVRGIMMRNTKPIDMNIYSVAAASSTPLPYVVESNVQYGAYLPEEARGGILGNGRRGVFLQPYYGMVQKSNPINGLIDQVPVREKVVHLDETEQSMMRKAAKSMRDFETKFDLGASNLNIMPVEQGQEGIPVITTSGDQIGSAVMTDRPLEQSFVVIDPPYFAVTGVVSEQTPDVPVTPQVNPNAYPGLPSYFNASGSPYSPLRQPMSPDSPLSPIPIDPTVTRPKSHNPMETFKNAWTSKEKTPAYIAIIVSTLLIGLLIVVLLLVGLVSMASASDDSPNYQTIVSYPMTMRPMMPTRYRSPVTPESSWMRRFAQ